MNVPGSRFELDRCPECGAILERGWHDCPMPDCDGRPKSIDSEPDAAGEQ